MGHQPRRRRARVATVLLGVLLVVGAVIGRPAPAGHSAQARVATAADVSATVLDQRVATVFTALNAARTAAGHAALQLDRALANSAVRDACAIARGDVALSGDRDLLAAAGAERENIGMVVDDDPLAAAQAVDRWWSGSRRHRRDRMHPEMARYGVGACNDGDRTYYVERFAR